MMRQNRKSRRSGAILALATATGVWAGLAGPSANAVEILLHYDEEVRPSYDPDGTELMRITRAAANYWEARILDTHTLTIDIHWGGGSGGSSGPTQFAGNRPVHGFIRAGSEESWYFDPTPFDNSEYNMTNWRYKDLTAQEKADYYRGVVPANLDAGQHAWVKDDAPVAAFEADLFHVMLHEIGHQLGVPWGKDGSSEMNDGDFDLVPSMVNAAAVAVRCPVKADGGYNTGHLANLHTLMQPWYADGERKLPSATDLLVGAAMSGWTQIDLERTTFIGNAGQTNWNNTAYWLANSMPDSTDHVIIGHGGICTIIAPAVARELVVDDGSELRIGHSLTVGQRVLLPAGCPSATKLSVVGGGNLLTPELVINGGSFEVSSGTAQVSGLLAMDNTLRSTGGLIVAETLNIGHTGNGIAYISGTGAITATTMNVGRAGVGDVRQSGGSVAVPVELVLGHGTGNVGVYDITAGTLYAQKALIGRAGTGNMTQSGGTSELTTFVAGDLGGSAGTYTLGGTGELTTSLATIGREGLGSFIQSGGLHRVNVNLFIGQTNHTPLSYYELSGGTLRTPGETIGYGRFKQLGGTHVVTGSLSLQNAEYQMLGGSLDANTITAGSGSSSNATFTHDAGTIDIDQELLVGSNGGAADWTQNGGTLLVPRLKVGGGGVVSFNQAGGTAIITEALTVGTVTGSLANALLSGSAAMIAPTATIGAGGSGKLTIDGGTLNVTGTMSLGTATGKTGTFELKAGSASAANFYVGDGGTGSYALRGGTHTVTGDFSMARTSASGASATIVGGTLDVKSGRIIVGQMKAAVFAQSGGTVIADEFILSAGSAFPTLTTAASTLRLNTFTGLPSSFSYKGTMQIGHAGGSGSGAMTLPATASGQAGNLDVGYNATGTLNQPTGTDFTIDHALDLGELAAGQGTCNMDGGYLTVGEMVRVGNAGLGVFNHRAGTANAGAALILGNAAGSSGTYNLGATGGSPTARAINQHIGSHGVGVFNHTGGSNRVTETLFLGTYGDGDGTYNLEGGTVYAATIDIGASGAGRFNWNGGSISADSIIIRNNGVLAASGDRWYYRAINCSGGTLDMAGHDLSLDGAAADFNLYSGQVNTANLYVGRSQGAVFTHIGGTNSASECLRIADDNGSAGTYDFQGGILSTPELRIGHGGVGQFNWTGGSLAADLITVGAGGTMDVSNSWSVGGTLRVEGGTVNLPLRTSLQVGGLLTPGTASVSAGLLDTDGLLIGANRSGTLNISGGTVVARALTAGPDNRSSGTINLTGGTLSIPSSAMKTVIIGAAGGGTLNLGDAAGTGRIVQIGHLLGVGMVVRSESGGLGTLRGWGQPELLGGLTNNGKIIAKGHGRERDLDLTNFSGILNSIENTGANGWFAEDHGRLLLPPISFAAGTSTGNWGEAADDTTIDLTNSARITLSGVLTAGSMSMSLLSPDHWDVPLGTGGKIVGLWNTQLGKLKSSSADITFRYDDARAAALGVDEASLRIYRFTQSEWVDVTERIDLQNRRITSESLSALGMLAVGSGVEIANQWAMAGGDYYGRTACWTAGTVPNGTSAVANFLEHLTAPADVDVSAAVVANTLNFRSPHAYTLAGRDSITLTGIKTRAAINVQLGDHVVEAPLALGAALDITIGTGHSISLAGPLENSAAKAITKSGAGSLTISGRQTHGAGATLEVRQGSATLASDARGGQLAITVGTDLDAATLTMGSSQHLKSLRLLPGSTASMMPNGQRVLVMETWDMRTNPAGAWDARLDLADNGMLIRAGEDPWGVYHTLRSQILAAHDAQPAWSGNGITTSMAGGLHTLGMLLNDGAGGLVTGSFMGEAVDSGCVMVRYTLPGDTDLSGAIDGDDFFRADGGYLAGGWRWQDGDFDYDGAVTQADWFLMDQAFLLTHPAGAAASAPVPEPGSLCLPAAALAALRRRRPPRAG